MANRFPLIVDSVNLNIKELPNGDNLDLTGSSIVNNSATITLPTVSGTLLTSAAIGTSVQAYDATILKSSDIGTSIQAYDADLTTWAGKTAPAGDVVGTTDTQTLSNKVVVALKETKVAMSANDIDLSAGNYFTKTISGTTTLTVSNVPTTGTVAAFVLDLTNGGSATVNWWSGMKWAGGTAPTLTSSGRDVLGFFTHDGGTTWNGLVLGKDVK